MNRELLRSSLGVLQSLFNSGINTLAVRNQIELLKAELSKPDPKPAGYFNEWFEAESARFEFEQVIASYAGEARVIPLYRKEDL